MQTALIFRDSNVPCISVYKRPSYFGILSTLIYRALQTALTFRYSNGPYIPVYERLLYFETPTVLLFWCINGPHIFGLQSALKSFGIQTPLTFRDTTDPYISGYKPPLYFFIQTALIFRDTTFL